MDVQTALATELEAYAGLTALVVSRIYPTRHPETPTLPLVVYRTISSPPEMTFTADGERPPARNPRIQISCYGATYASARAVADQVAACLDGHAGLLGGVGGHNCVATMVTELDLPDRDTGWARIVQDYMIWG